ncbi:hypothetical protein C0J52_05807 [Blattella germanica]|nr:hypothetical protein C0J52_05807 [Blattella germanica]
MLISEKFNYIRKKSILFRKIVILNSENVISIVICSLLIKYMFEVYTTFNFF